MHSSRMHTTCSLTVSRSICQGGMCPPAMHTPLPCMSLLPSMPSTMHTPHHTCPPAIHALLPHMPLPCIPLPHMPSAMHAPCHTHPLPCMPPLPCMSPCHAHPPSCIPPAMHAPHGQTDTCKNITFANFVWRR